MKKKNTKKLLKLTNRSISRVAVTITSRKKRKPSRGYYPKSDESDLPVQKEGEESKPRITPQVKIQKQNKRQLTRKKNPKTYWEFQGS